MCPIKYKEEINHLLKSVQKPKEFAVMHCKTHLFGNSSSNSGNQLADKTAKEVTEKGIIVLEPRKRLDVLEQKLNYCHQDRQLATVLEAKKNLPFIYTVAHLPFAFNLNIRSIEFLSFLRRLKLLE